MHKPLASDVINRALDELEAHVGEMRAASRRSLDMSEATVRTAREARPSRSNPSLVAIRIEDDQNADVTGVFGALKRGL